MLHTLFVYIVSSRPLHRSGAADVQGRSGSSVAFRVGWQAREVVPRSWQKNGNQMRSDATPSTCAVGSRCQENSEKSIQKKKQPNAPQTPLTTCLCTAPRHGRWSTRISSLLPMLILQSAHPSLGHLTRELTLGFLFWEGGPGVLIPAARQHTASQISRPDAAVLGGSAGQRTLRTTPASLMHSPQWWRGSWQRCP